jgi:polysaccharide deacetylase family protein (PEP-CTERM system associated)
VFEGDGQPVCADRLERDRIPFDVNEISNAFTVDVEDYFHVSAFERTICRSSWGSFESRVVVNTQRLLDLLAKHNVVGTFFILGWVAERFPSLVRQIAAEGHEVGSHSYWHRLVYETTPAEFREDLRRSIGVIEDAAGIRVNRYRAPSFSITQRSLWALEILVDEGIEVDSSIFPVRHDRYGIPGARQTIHVLNTSAGRLIEFPPSVARFGRFTLPVGGGGYFRLYSYPMTRTLLDRINSAEQRPFMFYVHPWEIDPDQPRLRAGSSISRFRHYVNLSVTERKLDRLLNDFSFGPMQSALRQEAMPVEAAVAPALL